MPVPRASTPAGLIHSSGWPSLMRRPITPRKWCRNVDLLSIEFAFRLPLRPRLTLGGRPFPRNPWAFGGRDSHPSYRYSYRHPHFPCLQPPLQSTFNGLGNAPLPVTGPLWTGKSAASVLGFSPDHFRRRITRPVSYYALFQGWLLLSQPPGCLCNPTSLST